MANLTLTLKQLKSYLVMSINDFMIRLETDTKKMSDDEDGDDFFQNFILHICECESDRPGRATVHAFEYENYRPRRVLVHVSQYDSDIPERVTVHVCEYESNSHTNLPHDYEMSPKAWPL